MKQIIKILISVCMVLTMLPTMTFAEGEAQDSEVITAFVDLAGDITVQTVQVGTEYTELTLPKELITTVTTDATATIAVSKWNSSPTYDGHTAGNYIFTPTLNLPNNLTIAKDTQLPTIKVTVQAKRKTMLLGALSAEQFTLPTGQTYYFDLSGQSIPGTVNTALPDTRLQYVPFTYVGTINAYSLDSSADGRAEATTNAIASDRSLFVADYIVTNLVSWNTLRDNNLIFGRPYNNYYTIRSLSGGNERVDIDKSANPTTNEWDQILNKNASWLKNWAPFSWIQDTHPTLYTIRGGRGHIDPHNLIYNSKSEGSLSNWGFRPVLEVGSANDLEVMILHLGTGRVGSENILSMVRVDGQFIAPSDTGLTPPKNGEFIYWSVNPDGSGTKYGTGYIVPSTVDRLYAQWHITYEVNYDSNGATGGSTPEDTQLYEAGASVTVADQGNLVREKHVFTGWNTEKDGSGTFYAIGSKVAIEAKDITLYAQWEPLYRVIYDSNGATAGTVPTDSVGYKEGQQATTVDKGSLIRAQHLFKGWNTEKDGSGTFYTVGSKVAIKTADVILYAQWNPLYKVTYDGNGATIGIVPTDVTEYEESQIVTVADKGSLARMGYTFVGWNTQKNGEGTMITDVLRMEADNVTLYAQWKVVQYTLTFDTGGGNAIPSQIVTHDAAVIEPPTPTKAGYTFGGWYKEPTFKIKWNFVIDVVTETRTLYAKWLYNSVPMVEESLPERFTVWFETNGGTLLDNQMITENEFIKDPPIPVKAGYIFDGWYKEPTFITKWNFATDRVKTTTKLYAKWLENNSQPIPTPIPEKPSKPVITFSDIKNNWAQEMIEDITSRGIITGYPDGTFRPNEFIKRQHVVVMIARAFELEAIREITPFTDVSASHPYYEAITKLQQAGIIDGSKGAFNPDAIITRAQMAKILVTALKMPLGGTSSFKDIDETHWGYHYITALEREGIALGSNGYFKPNDPLTRAQFVAFMYRAMNLQ
ncbi:InlB B-repeat-containing protein [Lysinibacillus piscis]|uniref:SLH domain-containing protein n=1 Tax=Lysinibacillus piscis TaxID=2518931 RepID=A0ABQ5NIF3_9BACI|nr:InlB B-repeat-containing protein [Lysinibacillus sp. KH24]GLC88058.1 hypothetical protein LYSBPC_11850 [Lysinibacillus sp. KH24]